MVEHRRNRKEVTEVGGSSPSGPASVDSSSGRALSVMRREAAGSSPAPRAEKLYAIARADLPVGLRTAQVGHVLIAWTLAYGEPPESLVVLAVKNLAELTALSEKLSGDVVRFHEPDLDDELTAIAAGPALSRALSSLSLLR